jgi:DNA polymerase-1
LNNIEKVKSARSREKLTAAREQILQNRKMVELDCDTALPIPLDELRLQPDYPGLLRACEEWELKSVLKEVQEEAAKAGVATQSELLL